MGLSKEKLRELDERLVSLALNDFIRFCEIARVNKIQAFVCIQSSKGLTHGQIANMVGIGRVAVTKRVKRCPRTKSSN